jgi:acetylornithine deacetylase
MAGPDSSLLRHLTELIEIPSVSGFSADWDMSNRPVVDYLATRFEALGFRIQVQEINGHPGKANLVATLGRGDGGLVLAGHTDTVPYDEGLWSTDPFKVSERDNRLYGLGMSDMKSFFALVLAACEGLKESDLDAPLIVLATADEETSMSGAKALAIAGGLTARYAIIGEPTQLRPVRMHKGIFMERIRIEGQGGHSSDPRRGNSALEGMNQVMRDLLEWRDEFRNGRQDHDFSVPFSTLNLGRIAGGDNPNRICRSCELDVDLRMLPGMTVAGLRGELRDKVRRSVAGSGLAVAFDALFDGVDPLETPANSQIVLAAEALTGVESGAVVFGTEGPFLAQLGAEVVILGPGSIEQAHQPDEYLALDTIGPMVDILRQMVRRFCLPTQP